MGFVMSIFYLPVFYGLQITSSYEVSCLRKLFFINHFHGLMQMKHLISSALSITFD